MDDIKTTRRPYLYHGFVCYVIKYSKKEKNDIKYFSNNV